MYDRKEVTNLDLLKATRHELKYTIRNMDRMVLMNRMDHILKRDAYCQEKKYIITSVYFDDYNNIAYLQKTNGDSIRYKYRIRFYNNDTSFLKLERKSKAHQMTMKVSARLTQEEVHNIYEGKYDFLKEKKEDIFKDFYIELAHRLIKPKVIVKYERVAFVHPVGDLRITFDTCIKTSNNQVDIFEKNIAYVPAMGADETIMEIKFNGVLPDYVRNLIQTANTVQSSSSKYVYSRKYNYEF
jgi:hypothetical protein